MQAASTRIRTYVLADLLLVSTAIGGLWMSGSFRSESPNAVGKVLVAALMVMLIAVVMGMYRRNAVTEPRFRARCLAAVLGCSFILGAGTSLFSGSDPTRLPLVLALTFCLAVMVGLRAVLHRMSFSEPQTRKILAVLPDSSVATLRKLSVNRRSAIDAVSADQDSSGELIPSAREALRLALNAPGTTDVVLADNLTLDSGLAMELAEQQRNGLRVTSLSRFMAEEFDRMPHNDPETLRRLILHSLPRSRASLLPKRMLDIVLSLVLLIDHIFPAAPFAIRAVPHQIACF